MVHYGQTIELQEERHAQGSPLLRCPWRERGGRERGRERERESLHSPLKRTEEDGQNHIVRGFKKEAYGCYEEEEEKKRNVLLKVEKNESAR